MRLVFAGTPEIALPALDAIAASRHELLAVLTRPDAPAGRGRRNARSAVARWADERGVPVLQPARGSQPDFLAELTALAPDCCPVVAYGALVPKTALDVPRLGWVNLHFSLLPAWRGAAPVQRAVMAGDEVTGATTFLLEEGLDTGPVLGVLTETIRPADTAGDLLERLSAAGAGLLVASLDGLEDGSVVPVPQPSDGVSIAPKVDRRGGAGRLADAWPSRSTGASGAAPPRPEPGRRSAASASSWVPSGSSRTTTACSPHRCECPGTPSTSEWPPAR